MTNIQTWYLCLDNKWYEENKYIYILKEAVDYMKKYERQAIMKYNPKRHRITVQYTSYDNKLVESSFPNCKTVEDAQELALLEIKQLGKYTSYK